MKKVVLFVLILVTALMVTSFHPMPVQAKKSCFNDVSGRVVDATGAGIPFVMISARGVRTLTWDRDPILGDTDPSTWGYFVLRHVKCGENVVLKAKLDGRVVRTRIDVYEFGAFQFYQLTLP